jgi:hypothetical protein
MGRRRQVTLLPPPPPHPLAHPTPLFSSPLHSTLTPLVPIPQTDTQEEVESLYRRFRSLDKGRKGFVTSEELLAIPEVSINPLHQRLARMFASVNFKEFAYLLSFFSPRASREDKVKFMFR